MMIQSIETSDKLSGNNAMYLEHFLSNLSTNAITPDTLGGDAEAEAQSDPLPSDHLAAHTPHCLYHGLDVNKLYERIVRLLDVDL